MGSLYSAAHDPENNGGQPRKRKRKSRRARKPPPISQVNTDFTPGVINLAPTEEQREANRRNQITPKTPRKFKPPITKPLPDPDLDDIPDVRRDQAGGSHTEPKIRGPRFDSRKTQTLPDPDMRKSSYDYDEEDDPEGLVRIADISLEEEVLAAVDQGITDAISSIRRLRQLVDILVQRAQVEDPTDQQVVSEVLWILDEAVEPWMLILDQRFDHVLQQTGEMAREVNEEPIVQDYDQPGYPENPEGMV